MDTSQDHEAAGHGERHELRFRPGEMPPLFGDTAAALIVDDDDQLPRRSPGCSSGKAMTARWPPTRLKRVGVSRSARSRSPWSM